MNYRYVSIPAYMQTMQDLLEDHVLQIQRYLIIINIIINMFNLIFEL